MLRCFSLVSGQSVMIILHSWAPCKDTLAAWLPKASLKRSCLKNERIRKKDVRVFVEYRTPGNTEAPRVGEGGGLP